MDPEAGWLPHYAGSASERGAGAGTGFNRNLALAPDAGDEEWLAALDLLYEEVVVALEVDAVVVSLGLDPVAADPESPLQVTEAVYFAADWPSRARSPVRMLTGARRLLTKGLIRGFDHAKVCADRSESLALPARESPAWLPTRKLGL